jgi:hypothetical protein
MVGETADFTDFTDFVAKVPEMKKDGRNSGSLPSYIVD